MHLTAVGSRYLRLLHSTGVRFLGKQTAAVVALMLLHFLILTSSSETVPFVMIVCDVLQMGDR